MDIASLCSEINLQPEIISRVLAFESHFDFGTVDKQMKDFLVYKNMKKAWTELLALLGEDTDHIKMLACMLKASADAYEIYKMKGISSDIYVATMKCYTRFIDETYQMTGRLYFDRYWWTPRQAGCHLFRIGELEYEIEEIEDKTAIEIHIPSDADFSPSAVEKSLEAARRFFSQYFPETDGVEYCCHSWLLDSQLKGMLREESNIIDFQKRFIIRDEGEEEAECIGWVFKKKTADYAELPEDTSLQRNMKKHLLSGGIIRNAYGKLR